MGVIKYVYFIGFILISPILTQTSELITSSGSVAGHKFTCFVDTNFNLVRVSVNFPSNLSAQERSRIEQNARRICLQTRIPTIRFTIQLLLHQAFFRQSTISNETTRCAPIGSPIFDASNLAFLLSSGAIQVSTDCQLNPPHSRARITFQISGDKRQICGTVSVSGSFRQASARCDFSGLWGGFSVDYSLAGSGDDEQDSTSFQPYSGVFTREKAAYLLNKIGFGVSKEDLEDAERLGLAGFVDKLIIDSDYYDLNSKMRRIVEPVARAMREKPQSTSWVCGYSFEASFNGTPRRLDPCRHGNVHRSDYRGYKRDNPRSLENYLTYHFLHGSPLAAALWTIHHNWFALSMRPIFSDWYMQSVTGEYVDDIFQNLLNFRDVLRKMIGNSHMLKWLDNFMNRRTGPNENFARELMELFTIKVYDLWASNFRTDIRDLVENYTDQDVIHLTRAAVGYQLIEITQCNPSSDRLPGYGPEVRLPCNYTPLFCPPRLVKIRDNNTESFLHFSPDYHLIRDATEQETEQDLIRRAGCIGASYVNFDRRFAFNVREWQRSANELPYFSNGVQLFKDTPWSISDRSQPTELNLNVYPRVINQPSSSNPMIPIYNPIFTYTSEALQNRDVRDNLTDHLLFRHGYIMGAGSSASRALAIQLLSYFIGPKAAKNINMVREISNDIWNNRFNLKEVLRKILTSRAIFSDEHQGTVFKTAYEFGHGIARTLRLPIQLNLIPYSEDNSFERFSNIWHLGGYPNLNMPSVFGIPMAGQRGVNIIDGRGLATPFFITARLRHLARTLDQIHSILMLATNLPDMSRPIHVEALNPGDRTERIRFGEHYHGSTTYHPQRDAWGSFGDSNTARRYVLTNYAGPYVYAEDVSNLKPLSGNRFSWLDHISRLGLDASNPEHLIRDIAMRFGVRLTEERMSILSNYFRRLDPTESAVCWDNFRDYSEPSRSITAFEARRRYFDAKFVGIVWALLNMPDAWIK